MTGAAPLFDTYIAVDWSARSSPATGADTIWIAVLDRAAAGPTLSNPPTRHLATAQLTALVEAHADRRILLGIDVSLGYPAGAAAQFGVATGGEAAWRSTWAELAELIDDDERNRNNRFEVAAALNLRTGAAAGPFWGCPHGRRIDGLAPTKSASRVLDELRATERALRTAGWAPASTWQLTGAGSVGGQTLTAVPVLQRLVDGLGRRAAVWPFTTGLVAPSTSPGTVVIAEVWPTPFEPPYPAGTVRDAAQVQHVVRRCAEADDAGSLAGWFAPPVAPDLVDRITSEEGWVLGPPRADGRRPDGQPGTGSIDPAAACSVSAG